MYGTKISQQYDLLGCNNVLFGNSDVSEEYIASVFRIEK
jgi:hypothetical protein